ncbi:nicotinamide phosphoribosyltransferase domain-containing protein [Paenibacillus methanolicus]|uniref:Nicotinamide phosphoribosyltransferase n=1 Tax=Paenibacillus methanolicus TaxID=582686 RepID=A0A5S5CJ21_9BACL|nr:nicotinamide phosphoribosyltransferase domain-containing protein [Paenibacillus methanolicus]TYP79524.1 nicotinamide phosphoribosyltransferase [Paenibacillus methanolicus]
MMNQLRTNVLLLTDSYNLSHSRLKCSTDWEVSHLYNRKTGMILYGFREIALSVLNVQITKVHIEEAERCAAMQGLAFPSEIFHRVVDECGGYAPLAVESLPEGTWCPAGTPFAQIRNTVEGFGELVTWWEGVLMHAYFPSACATEAFHMRRYLEEEREALGADESFYWRFHSFGFRGHRSLEDAYWAGTAWNLSLQGTDDFHTTKHAPRAIIGSIAALAHKVTQQYDDELQCFMHAIDSTADCGESIVALVIDTYDANRVIAQYLPVLAERARERGVKIVMRPDSGDVLRQAIDIYKAAERHGALAEVGVIIGEGMSFEQAKRYDRVLEENGVPLAFVAYGIGSGFYNHIDRDTLGWAMKTAYSNGKDRMKFSMDPLKRSIPGRVGIVMEDEALTVLAHEEMRDGGLYETVYAYDGEARRETKPLDEAHWTAVRDRVRTQAAPQERIRLSARIVHKMEQIAAKYGVE